MKSWEQLPVYMKTDELLPYYKVLKNKQVSLCIKRIFDLFVSLLFVLQFY